MILLACENGVLAYRDTFQSYKFWTPSKYEKSSEKVWIVSMIKFLGSL